MDDFMALVEESEDTEIAETYEAPELPIIFNKLDPEAVAKQFEAYKSQIDSLTAEVEATMIEDESAKTIAIEKELKIKALIKTIEEERKNIKAPYLAVTKEIDSKVKGLTISLSNAASILHKKAEAYMIEQQERREKQIEELKENLPVGSEDILSVIPEIPTPIMKMPAGKAEIKLQREWKITNFKELPNELFIAREQEIVKAITPWINEQMKLGITEISGVEFSTVKKMQTKAGRKING